MFEKSFRCFECGKTFPTDRIRYRCDCGGSLDITYDYEQISKELGWKELKSRELSHHRYTEFFPVLRNENFITMGEGGTPLIRSREMEKELGVGELYFKLESLNPTGSFKDRGTTVEIGKALDHGAGQVVVASTGNMGASVAAYSARAGIEAKILVPENVSEIKLKQMKTYGANIKRIDGDYSRAAEKARELHKSQGTYLMGDYAYRGEGEKSVGFEIADELNADKVVLPIGNGTLMHGTYKGFKELKKTGLIENIPEMVGIQAEGCSTVAKAFKEGRKRVEPVKEAITSAGAIACADPLDGDFALEAVEESGGFADAVSDEKIERSRDVLAQEEGIYAEFSSGAAVAGMFQNVDRFGEDDIVVCVITGHGLKDLI